MRNLNIEEFDKELFNCFSEVKHANLNNHSTKVDHLLFFIENQPIAKRIVDRFSLDYNYIIHFFKNNEDQRRTSETKRFMSKLRSNQEFGVLSYSLIIKREQSYDRMHRQQIHFLNDCEYIKYYDWNGGDYRESKYDFNEMLITPIENLFKWYLYEVKREDEHDYFNLTELEELSQEVELLRSRISESDKQNQIILEGIIDLKSMLASNDVRKSKTWFVGFLKENTMKFGLNKGLEKVFEMLKDVDWTNHEEFMKIIKILGIKSID